MKTILLLIFPLFMLASFAHAQIAPDSVELSRLLHEFLAGASRNDAAIHDRFWAEDLMYTRSAGQRTTKAEIMQGVRSAPATKPDDPVTEFTAEDVHIQQYGATAIVAFRLVGTTKASGKTQVANFLNTGTFLKRNGRWQVVAWQATKVPKSEDQSRNEITEVSTKFQSALASADMKTLESLADESFHLVDGNRDFSREQLLMEIKSGKSFKTVADSVEVSVFGDAGVVRSKKSASYTMMLVNSGGEWKVVAMHVSKR